MTRPNDFTAATKRKARERAGGKCEVHRIPHMMYRALPESCSRKAEEVDHITPAIVGGGRDLSNAAVLCTVCHKIKTVTDNREAKKQNRLRGKTGQQARSKRNGSSFRKPTVSPLSRDHPNYRKQKFQQRKMT